LSPAFDDSLIFEHPLSERVRTWLRLEELFSRTHTHAARRDAMDHRAALLGLFEIVDTATRSDLKTDLLAELDRQRSIWSAQLDNPDIAREALEEFLADTDAVIHDLHSQLGKIGHHLKDSEWLQAMRQRAATPGGACIFELPMLMSWLQRPEHDRKEMLKSWLAPVVPLEEAVLLVLRLLRESIQTTTEVARHGNFHRALMNQRPPMLAMIEVETDQCVVSEVSANKYTVNVRFLDHGGQFMRATRAMPTMRDVPFRLGLCSL
ncbi:MAG: cell division protein ZapD, partial [Casimicrobium sp.]